jgi:hypothetical protein
MEISSAVLHLKMIFSWGIAPCNLLEVNRRFRGTYCLHHQDDLKRRIYFHEVTRRYIPENCYVCNHRPENLTSRFLESFMHTDGRMKLF